MVEFIDFEEVVCEHRTYLAYDRKGVNKVLYGYLRYDKKSNSYEFGALPDRWLHVDILHEIVTRMKLLNKELK